MFPLKIYGMLKAAILSIVILVISSAAVAQQCWRSVIIRSKQEFERGMIGGEAIQHMQGAARSESEPDIIYLSHDCAQVWRSNDNGKSWLKCRCEGMHVIGGQSIAVDPKDADRVLCMVDATHNYMVKKSEGIYLSTDGGDSWRHVLQANTEYQRFSQSCIAYDDNFIGNSQADKWYAAVAFDAMYISSDGGESWAKGADISALEHIYSIRPAGGGRIYIASDKGLYCSDDSGQSVRTLGNLPAKTISAVEIDPKDKSIIYAVVQDDGLYKSTDSGRNFSLLLKDSSALFFRQNKGFPKIMYLSRKHGQMLYSTNAGKSWQQVTTTSPLGLERQWMKQLQGPMTSILPDPRDSRVCTVYAESLAWRTSNGRHFLNSSERLTGYNWGWCSDSVAYDIENPDRFIFFCFDVSMGITENGGKWFTRYRTPYDWFRSGKIKWISMHAGDIYPETGSKKFAIAGGMTFDLKLMLTTDGGRNLKIVDGEEHYNLLVAFNRNNPKIVYAGKKRSTDAGESYKTIDFLENHNAVIVGVSRSNPDVIYAIGDDRHSIFRSKDTGISWHTYAQTTWQLGTLDSRPGAFDVDPENPDIVYAFGPHGQLGRFDGHNWEFFDFASRAPIPTNNNYVDAVQVDPRHREIIYVQMAGAGSSQVFRSCDYGKNWEDITFNLPQVGSCALSVHPLTGDVLVSSGCGTRLLPAPYKDEKSIYKNLTPEAPVAKAGGDFTVTIPDGKKEVTIELKGSDSSAIDSEIIKSSWSFNGREISSDLDCSVELPAGTHKLRLDILDNNSIKAFDYVTVTVEAQSTE